MCNNSFDNCRGKKLPVFYTEKSNPRQPLALIADRKSERKRPSGSTPYEQCCLEKASIVNATLEQWHIRSQLPIEWAEKGLWLEIALAGEHTCRERSIEPFGGPSSCQSCKSGHLVGRRIEAVESFNAKPLSNRRHVPSLQRQNEKCPSELTKYQGGTSSKLPQPPLALLFVRTITDLRAQTAEIYQQSPGRGARNSAGVWKPSITQSKS